MKDTFGTYHPIINFSYFCAVIVFGMFFLHPVLLLISLSGAFAYSVYLSGKRALIFNLGFLLPLMLLVAAINPLFNHRGVTILGYLRDNPITLESIFYGLASGLMFASIILWFSCYNAVMTSDKFVYLFGRLIPAMSLILSMGLRFVPKFKAQARVIADGQKCVGRDLAAGSAVQRAGHGLKILSILTTWALENAVDTADSMRSRGYGLPGRTAFSIFRFDGRDRAGLWILLLLAAVVLAGAALSQNTMQYFPMIRLPAFSPLTVLIWTAYLLLCYLPMIINVREDMKWRRLQLKI